MNIYFETDNHEEAELLFIIKSMICITQPNLLHMLCVISEDVQVNL